MAGSHGINRPIHVLLVEDDAPTRERLCDALARSPAFSISSAETLAEAMALLGQEPDVLLTDLRLTDGHGLTLIREARRRLPRCEIMVISVLGDEESVLAAIRVGASGYLLKDSFPDDIARTVHDLVAGQSPISASIARYIVRRAQGQGAEADIDRAVQLTPREIDILWGIAKGFRYADIADHLGMSRQTVPEHIKNIYRKLEVNTRGEAVFEAIQQGLIKL
jgi:DNA-binding NarL/FixJ family response regulator